MTTTTEQRLRTRSNGSPHGSMSAFSSDGVRAQLLFALLFAFPIAGLCWWAAPLDEVHAEPRAVEYLLDLAETASESGPVPQEPVYGATMGAFHLLTYNTAGLPPIINGLNAFRHFKIGHGLNAYDLALVQEDFFYHDRLTFFIKHPFQSQLTFYHYWLLLVLQGRLAPDSLHRFSSMPFLPIERIPWTQCQGTLDFGYDCLALKGFSVSTHWAAPDVSFDVYNLHMDAGGHPGDAQARLIGLEQMRVRMEERAETGRAVIAAGDWNARWSNADDQNLLTRARDELGLIDGDAYLAVE